MKHAPSLQKPDIGGFVTGITSENEKKRNMFFNKTIRVTRNRHDLLFHENNKYESRLSKKEYFLENFWKKAKKPAQTLCSVF